MMPAPSLRPFRGTPAGSGLPAPGAGPRIAHRPNDGSGLWADYSNTGYLHYTGAAANPEGSGLTIPCTHGYTGLYDFTSGMTAGGSVLVDSSGPLSRTFSKVHFRGKMYIGDNARCDTMIFNGCVLDGTWPNDNLAQIYLPVLWKLSYCTLKPATLSSPPGNNGTVGTSRTAPGTPYTSSWEYVAEYDNSTTSGQTGKFRTEMDYCDIWGNAGMEVTGNGTSSNPTYFNWCYIHDQADNDCSGAVAASAGIYHHDGIGPDSTGPETWINVTNCTVASLGNTNAIAFQGSAGCNNCILTGNYFSGFGLTVDLSFAGPTADYSVTFTDNVFSAEVPYVFGPVYALWSWNSGGTPPTANTAMLWRRNQWQVRAGDPSTTWTYSGGPVPGPTGLDTTFQGQYWWPSDQNAHAADYTG